MIESHTINASDTQRLRSQKERYGDRYYPVDPSYDKRVYENSNLNIVRIVATLIGFWIFNAMHWWAILVLGIVDSEALGWYSIGCFFFTVFFLAGLLTSGKYANQLKREHEFYYEKIAELKAEEKDKETKKKQEAAHQKKIEDQRAREELIAAKERAEKATAGATTGGAIEMVPIQQQQQDGRLIRTAINEDNRA